MNRLFIFIFLLFNLSFPMIAQNSSWKSFGLKEPVKSFTEKSGFSDGDTAIWMDSKTYLFNKLGLVTTQIDSNLLEDLVKARWLYEYDKTNRLIRKQKFEGKELAQTVLYRYTDSLVHRTIKKLRSSKTTMDTLVIDDLGLYTHQLKITSMDTVKLELFRYNDVQIDKEGNPIAWFQEWIISNDEGGEKVELYFERIIDY